MQHVLLFPLSPFPFAAAHLISNKYVLADCGLSIFLFCLLLPRFPLQLVHSLSRLMADALCSIMFGLEMTRKSHVKLAKLDRLAWEMKENSEIWGGRGRWGKRQYSHIQTRTYKTALTNGVLLLLIRMMCSSQWQCRIDTWTSAVSFSGAKDQSNQLLSSRLATVLKAHFSAFLLSKTSLWHHFVLMMLLVLYKDCTCLLDVYLLTANHQSFSVHWLTMCQVNQQMCHYTTNTV